MPNKLLSSLGGRLLLSIVIGISVVSVITLTFSVITGRRLNLADEIGVFIAQIAMVSLPFIVISLLGANKPNSWLVGLAMTLTIWGIYFLDGLARVGSGTGANIGLGLILVISPLIILGVCLVVMKREEDRPQPPAGDT